MFNWLKKLYSRCHCRSYHERTGEHVEECPKYEEPELEPKPTVDHLRRPKPDLIARQGGQKRNRYHVYEQPYGYPIRRCDWVAVDREALEDAREIPGKEADVAIRIMKGDQAKRVCSHCLAIGRGRRGNGSAEHPVRRAR